MVKVSVVIPAKNRAKTLPACLDSVLNQTDPAQEVIVVDDGSTDNTPDIVATYATRGVIYAKLPVGAGAQAARNYGIKLAAGNWIAFQDSDDLWLPNKLARQLAVLHTRYDSPDIVVHTMGYRLNQTSGVQYLIPQERCSGSCYEALLRRPSPMFPSLLVSKIALEKIGYLDEQCPSYQEWDTAIRLARICSFVHLDVPTFIWVWHSGETISKNVHRDIAGHRYIIEKFRHEIIATLGQRQWRKHVLRVVAKSILNRELVTAQMMVDQHLPTRYRPLTTLFLAYGHRLPKRVLRLLELLSYL